VSHEFHDHCTVEPTATALSAGLNASFVTEIPPDPAGTGVFPGGGVLGAVAPPPPPDPPQASTDIAETIIHIFFSI
jgi:hypothetical protein